MLFDKLWGKPKNITFLGQYTWVLKWLKLSRDIKNFDAYDIFFKYLINAYVITLVMEESN